MSRPQMALFIIVANAIVMFVVGAILYKVLHALYAAACVMGGEDLTKCLR